MNAKGFSLIEIAVALGTTAILGLATTTLIRNTVVENEAAVGRFDSVRQRSELRRRIFTAPNNGVETCVQRLGLNGSEIFQPGQDFALTNLGALGDTRNVKIESAFLKNASVVGATPTGMQYTAQIVVQQSIRSGGQNRFDLAPQVIGLLKFEVNSNRHISGCNWDANTADGATFCSEVQGMAANSNGNAITCIPDIQTPIIGTCPSGTTMDFTSAHCIPSSIDCFRRTLAENFDGNALGCNDIPAIYGIRYPANYTPPNRPQSVPPPPPQQPAPPVISTAQPCQCGQATLQPGDQRLCIRAYNKSEGFGNYDDMWEVKVCNTAGVLQQAPKPYVFEEEGNGDYYGWAIGNCQYYGGTKYQSGISYATGNCIRI